MTAGGIILAAGRSTRMGSPKALLSIGEESFLERAIRVLAEGGCRPVTAVLPPEGESGRMAGLVEAAGGSPVVNPVAGAEQVDSLRIGLAALSVDHDCAVVLPVDHARVHPQSVTGIIEAFRARRAPIVRPVYDGHPGHPVLFARELWEEFDGELECGARDIVHRHANEIEDVPVLDPGVAIDIDTPEDYARATKA